MEYTQFQKTIKNFEDNVWDQHKESIVLEANMAKFQQNAGLRKLLLSTGDALLAQHTYSDYVWGTGMGKFDLIPEQWPGKNLLGKILVKVRSNLKSSTHYCNGD